MVDWEDWLDDIHDEIGDIGYELKKRLTCEVRESLGKEYQKAASNTIVIGKYLDTLAKTLIRNSPNQIQENIKTYCIGHSLGAQVCGFFGKNFQKKGILENGDDGLNGIIGLDPAGPIFENHEEHSYNKTQMIMKLYKGDAKVVQILHSNDNTFGHEEPIGDVDFYLNDGKNQPQCVEFLSYVEEFADMAEFLKLSKCSHSVPHAFITHFYNGYDKRTFGDNIDKNDFCRSTVECNGNFDRKNVHKSGYSNLDKYGCWLIENEKQQPVVGDLEMKLDIEEKMTRGADISAYILILIVYHKIAFFP